MLCVRNLEWSSAECLHPGDVLAVAVPIPANCPLVFLGSLEAPDAARDYEAYGSVDGASLDRIQLTDEETTPDGNPTEFPQGLGGDIYADPVFLGPDPNPTHNPGL